MIVIKNTTFDNNPTGMNPDLVFMGTVHNGAGAQENVYGFNEEDVIRLAKKLKIIDKDFNTVHIWGPCDGLKRNYIGYKII